MEQNLIHQIFTNNPNKSISERKPFFTKYEKEVLKLNSEKKIVRKKKKSQKFNFKINIGLYCTFRYI